MTAKTKFRIALLVLYTAGLLTLVASCNGQTSQIPQPQNKHGVDVHLASLDGIRQIATEDVPDERVPPIWVCTLIDHSGSSAFYKVYPPTPSEVRIALDAVSENGGIFAVGAIFAAPSDPLVRETFSKQIPPPEGEDKTKDVFTRRRQRRTYKRALPAWEEAERIRRRDNNSLAEGFLIRYEKFLASEWDPNASNVWDSVKRCVNMLQEDPHHWTSGGGPAPLKYLVLVSDGRANAGSGYEPLPSDITPIAVSGVEGLGDLAQIPGIRYFESSDAAYRFIASHAKDGGAR